MHEPAGKGGDDGFDTPQFPTGAEDRPATRTWVHPSEVGMAQRKRSDRRRGTLMAAALVLGGVSVLSVCVTLGLGSTTRSATSPGARDRAVAATVASLTVVRGVHSSTTTGIVIDDDGHIAVRAGAVVDATELWASTGSREPARVTVVATDPQSDVAIVSLPEGSGRPAIADTDVRVGDRVLVARAGSGEAGPTVSYGRVTQTGAARSDDTTLDPSSPRLQISTRSTAPAGATTTMAAVSTVAVGAEQNHVADGAVFDIDGHFIGLITGGDEVAPDLLPATSVLRIGLELAR